VKVGEEMSQKPSSYCIFCGVEIHHEKSHLLPFPKNPYLVSQWCLKFSLEPIDINLRFAKICLNHYNMAVLEEGEADQSFQEVLSKENIQKAGKRACIICAMLCPENIKADAVDLIPFPKDEDVKRAWSEKFGVDLTPINHNAASICMEHYEQAAAESVVAVNQVKPGTCLMCNLTRRICKAERSQLIP
jgi:hypothetical protein